MTPEVSVHRGTNWMPVPSGSFAPIIWLVADYDPLGMIVPTDTSVVRIPVGCDGMYQMDAQIAAAFNEGYYPVEYGIAVNGLWVASANVPAGATIPVGRRVPLYAGCQVQLLVRQTTGKTLNLLYGPVSGLYPRLSLGRVGDIPDPRIFA